MRHPLLVSIVPLFIFASFLVFRLPFLPSSRQLASWTCRMSWMSPSYIHITSFNKTIHPIADKYKLFYYREAGWDGNHTPNGQPVLYIPGNAGSMMQVRSIASSASRQYWIGPFIPNKEFSERGIKPLDFFTADFNEALSAFHGPTLFSQSDYVSRAIPHILSQYDHLPASSRPTSVHVLGHSMGGIVARQAALLLSDPSQVQVVLTLSTPHQIPPIASDSTMYKIYSSINSFTLSSTNTSLISICGGSADPTLASDACALPVDKDDRQDETRLGVFTSGMVGTWTGVDHEAMVWCHQVRSRIARLLLEFGAGPSTPLQRKHKAMDWLVGKSIEANDVGVDGDRDMIQKNPPSAAIQTGESFVSGSSSSSQSLLFKIPAGSSTYDLMSTYTTMSVGAKNSASARIYQCISYNKPLAENISLKCVPLRPTRIELVPPSPVDRTALITGEGVDEEEGMVFFQGVLDEHLKANPEDRWVLIETDGVGWGVHSFENRRKESVQVREDGFWKYFIGGVLIDQFQHVGEKLHRQVFLKNAVSHSLLVYKVSFSESSCTSTPLFRPLLSHETIPSHRLNYEKSFYPNPSAKSIYLHSQSAGAPFLPSTYTGFILDLWEDPSSRCEKSNQDETNRYEGRSVLVKIDLEASLGRLLLRYRGAVSGWSIGVVAFVIGVSIQQFRSTGIFPSFEDSMSYVIRTYIVQMTFSIVSLSLIQTILSYTFPTSQNIFALLLGVPGLMFIPFHVVFFGIIIGLVNIVYGGLKGWILISARGMKMWKGDRKDRLPDKDDKPFRIIRLLPVVVLLGSVLIMIPYQVAFLVLYLIHFQTTLSSYVYRPTTRGLNGNINQADLQSVSRSNFYMSLLFFKLWLVPLNGAVLVVWVRDLMGGWIERGGPDRSIIKLLGSLMIVEVCARGGFLREKAKNSVAVQVFQIAFFLLSACSFLIGSQQTFRLYSFSNGLLALAALGCLSTGRTLGTPPS